MTDEILSPGKKKTTTKLVPKLWKALLAAQKVMRNPEKNAKGHKNKYANIQEVLAATKSVLNDHGVVIWQGTTETDIAPDFRSMVVHIGTRLTLAETGESIQNSFPFLVSTNNPQDVGGVITYGKRYGLEAICAVAGEEYDQDLDDKPPQRKGAEQVKQGLGQPTNIFVKSDAEGVEKIKAALAARKIPNINQQLPRICEALNGSSYEKLPGLLDRFYPQTKGVSA